MTAGERMMERIRQLYPVCRSITGDGNRETLRILQERIPLTLYEVPSGTPVLDWVVPDEWNVREAWIKGPNGQTLVDFRKHNLHLVGYSNPVHGTMSLEALQQHLHSLPNQPNLIPYRTSYYGNTWGFCLSDEQRKSLPDGNYEVCIDADKKPGHLTYAEVDLPGDTEETFLISTHICHPSLCNDNLSGLAVAEELILRLLDLPRRHRFRFLFIPGTIGSITWLAQHRKDTKTIRHGLVLSCLGDAGPMTYKQSRRGNAEIDRISSSVLDPSNSGNRILPFEPYGYDERQFGSPGFNLPVGLLTRSPHGTFPEYHTSGDNLDLVRPEALEDSLQTLLRIVQTIDQSPRYRNTQPLGEPQLGRRGLYDVIGGANDQKQFQLALLWVLNQSDGTHSLADIAVASGMPDDIVQQAADALVEKELLECC